MLLMEPKAADRFLEVCFPPISRRLPGRGSAGVFGWKWTPSAEARVRTLRRGHREANMTPLPCGPGRSGQKRPDRVCAEWHMGVDGVVLCEGTYFL